MDDLKLYVELTLCELYLEEFKNAFATLTKTSEPDENITQIENCLVNLETKLGYLERHNEGITMQGLHDRDKTKA